jgi:hypothetical protein
MASITGAFFLIWRRSWRSSVDFECTTVFLRVFIVFNMQFEK